MSSNIPPESDSSQGAHGRPWQPAPLSSDELLPPVEPPSAGFLLQLFVVPAVIVAAVVLLWFTIESLARSGEQDPEKIIRALRSSNQARFQQAKELADMLRQPERYKLNANRALAEGLATLLAEKVEAGDDAEAEVTMRIFLAMALGEFHVDAGLPALVQTARGDPQRDVRRRAINAIAVLASGLAELRPPQYLASEELIATLTTLADDQDELIRSETAFALGVVAVAPGADPRLTAALEELADDPYTDARFNAAIGLARLGSPQAAAALAEMLDPESLASSLAGEQAMTPETTEAQLRAKKAYKRDTILGNALSAIDQLATSQSLSPADRAALDAALEKFIAAAPAMQDPAPVPREVIDAMQRTQQRLRASIRPSDG